MPLKFVNKQNIQDIDDEFIINLIRGFKANENELVGELIDRHQSPIFFVIGGDYENHHRFEIKYKYGNYHITATFWNQEVYIRSVLSSRSESHTTNIDYDQACEVLMTHHMNNLKRFSTTKSARH